MDDKKTEHERRAEAQRHKGEIVEGSGNEVGSTNLEHVISLRLDGAILRRLRELAGQRDTTVSALMRNAIHDYVTHGSQTTRFEWKVVSAEGTSPVHVNEWPETPASRSALHDVSETARAS